MKKQGTAYYAREGSRMADFWTLLHPPYTAWNLSYVVIGSALAHVMNWPVLMLMLLAFFCGTGIGAHALDELNGRPLKTGFNDGELKILAAASLISAMTLAVVLVQFTSLFILVLAGIGVFLVLAYNLEWWNGLFHTDLAFALSWGAFPVLAGYWSQTGSFTAAALAGAAAAAFLTLTQRSLSTPARFLRRQVNNAEVVFQNETGKINWEKEKLLASWEKPLKLLSWFVVILALSLLILKL